jgi:predicted amidophosphoribosyltransferase
MSRDPKSAFEVICPCCGARLTIDSGLGKVLHHTPPPKHAKAPDIDHAAQLLEKEKARREALFAQSTEDQKHKSELLQRKFEEALKQRKDEPATPPLRDIDLD